MYLVAVLSCVGVRWADPSSRGLILSMCVSLRVMRRNRYALHLQLGWVNEVRIKKINKRIDIVIYFMCFLDEDYGIQIKR